MKKPTTTKPKKERIQIDSKFWPDDSKDIGKVKAAATLMYWNVESCWNKRVPSSLEKPLRVCDAMKQLSIITKELPITFTVTQKAQYLKTQIIEHGQKQKPRIRRQANQNQNQRSKVHVI